MKCSACGIALQPNAKFCPECGQKVAPPLRVEFAPLATSLPVCEVNIRGISADEPDDDDTVRIKVDYDLRNATASDWQYVSVRMQVLTPDGCPIEETIDQVERFIRAGSVASLSMESDPIAAALLGADPSRAQVVIGVVAGTLQELELGQAAVPNEPFQSVVVRPQADAEAVRIHRVSLWKTAPDGDGDSYVAIKLLAQNLTAATIPKIDVIATLKTRSGEELASARETSELRAGGTAVLDGRTGYTRSSALADAKASITLRVYPAVAIGLAHSQATQPQPVGAITPASVRATAIPAAQRPPAAPPAPPRVVPTEIHRSDPAPPPSAPVSSQKVAAAIERFLATVRDGINPKHLFLRPNIVKYKLDNALASIASGASKDDVIALIDTTVFGSGKDGLVVTAATLYAKDLGSEPKQVKVRDVREIRYVGGLLSEKLMVNGLDLFSPAGSGLKADEMKRFAEALERLCQELNH